MPDRRTQRGPNPRDLDCFAASQVPVLRTAVTELSWLLERGYSPRSSLKLVGDRHSLRDRQRRALQRCAASTTACLSRERTKVEPEELRGRAVEIDGYNVLLTLEAALSGGLLLLARDGAMRDLAAMSAHYRRVHTTRPAIGLLADFLEQWKCPSAHLLLDRPVSNSARLKAVIQSETEGRSTAWSVELASSVDARLKASHQIVATADSAILDRCRSWVNLARIVVEQAIPDAWIVDLSGE